MTAAEGISGQVRQLLEEELPRAEALAKSSASAQEAETLGPLGADVLALSQLRHHARGVALTLAATKAVVPAQDVRCHQVHHPGGFGARAVDHSATVPFLQAHALHHATDTHWLTRRLVEQPYSREWVLKTVPKEAGPLLTRVVCGIEEAVSAEASRLAVRLLLSGMVFERERARVALTRPKGLTIQQTVRLLGRHFDKRYSQGAPRLPQLALWALYHCMVGRLDRFRSATLEPLERMKSADRKSGTVGDIVVTDSSSGRPMEAVEVKHGIPLALRQVTDVVDKIRSSDVRRYYILSTAGILSTDADAIARACDALHRAHGCELIVNGVLDSLRYSLRLVPSPDEMLATYVDLVGTDRELGFEHREAWNRVAADGGA